MTNTSKELVKFDLDTKELTVIATDLPNDLYGLTTGANNELLAFEDDGDVWSIDAITGDFEKVDNIDSKGDVYGAAKGVETTFTDPIYPISIWEDGEDLEQGKIQPPEGWYTDNSDGKIEVDDGGRYGLKSGNNVIELEAHNHDENNNLYTLIDSQEDSQVVIDFDFSARDGHTGVDANFEVLIDGVVVATITPEQVGFEHKTITVDGTGETMRVEFKSIGNNTSGAVLDNINIGQKPNNQDPIAEDDTANGTEDNTLVIAVADLLANDSDPDGDEIFEFSVQEAVNGNVSYVGDNVEFYPDAGYTGPASFTYTITDGKGGFDTATVNLTIEEAPNEAPVVAGETLDVDENTVISTPVADLLANDVDPEGKPLTIVSVQDALNGTVELVDGNVIFTPDAGYTGPASYTYTVSDGEKESVATVDLTVKDVNEAPVVAGEALDGTEDTAVVTPVAALLANDTDPDGDTLAIVSVQDAVNGTVALVNDEVIFTPDADYNGPASYTYTVSDGEIEETATVNLTIVAANDNPTAGDDLFEGPFIEGQPIAIDVAKVLENDFDIDGDAVRANAVVDSFGGSFAMIDGVPTFVPDAGFVGDATLTYQITDDQGGVDTATITFKIIANPNQNPVANDDDLGVFEMDTPAAINVASILSNDTDADGDTLTPTAVVATENGQFAFINGVPSFVPDAGFIGTASLTYEVSDGNGGTDTATIFFEFIDPDQAPQAEDDMAEGLANNNLVIDPADLLANDLDPEGKPLTLVSVGNPVNGTVAIVAGQIIFTPDDGYKGPASFTYVVADPAGNEGTATVNLAINDNTIYGTPNDDIPLNGTEGNDYIKGLEGDDTINGLGGDDFIYGGPGKDTIDAGDGDDTVLGGYDDDRIEGGKGNDILNGNQGNDTLKGGDDDDTLNGSSGNDLLLGQEGNDKLYGDAGDDTLEGGNGDDLLQGGQENDVLTGGLGADTFLWTGNDIQPHGNGRETDIITDFNTAEGDKLDLADLLVNEQNSDNLDRYLDFNYDDSTGDTTIAISSLGSFEKSDDSIDCQQLADQLIVLEGVDLTAGNTISDENIIQNMLNNNQLIVDSL